MKYEDQFSDIEECHFSDQVQVARKVNQESYAEERVRIAAYFNWENSTGGNPVDEDTTRQFWLDAEQQVSN